MDFYILVPQCLLSPLIGIKGININKIKKETFTDIYFDSKTSYPRSSRSARITGNVIDIKNAIF